MTPKEFHEACHEACMHCPQFRPFDDDSLVELFNATVRFDKIPKKGLYAVYQFWKHDSLLMDSGYYACLTDEAKDVFERIEKVIKKAIKKEFS